MMLQGKNAFERFHHWNYRFISLISSWNSLLNYKYYQKINTKDKKLNRKESRRRRNRKIINSPIRFKENKGQGLKIGQETINTSWKIYTIGDIILLESLRWHVLPLEQLSLWIQFLRTVYRTTFTSWDKQSVFTVKLLSLVSLLGL